MSQIKETRICSMCGNPMKSWGGRWWCPTCRSKYHKRRRRDPTTRDHVLEVEKRNRQKPDSVKLRKQTNSDYYYRMKNDKRFKAIRRKHSTAARSKRRARNRQFVFNFLLDHPCVDCKETDPIVLQFDHVRGNKEANISWMISRASPINTIVDEIKKCVVRCANCHTRRTARRYKWFKQINQYLLQQKEQSRPTGKRKK